MDDVFEQTVGLRSKNVKHQVLHQTVDRTCPADELDAVSDRLPEPGDFVQGPDRHAGNNDHAEQDDSGDADYLRLDFHQVEL